jgi:hypothetical protein
MLLLSAMHDVATNPDCDWKTIKGKPNSNPTLTYYNWMEFVDSSSHIQFTIEHIAPQNPKPYDWDSSLDDGELTNTLGNLVILSRGDNSEASNHSWTKKKILYNQLADKKHEVGVDRNYNQFIKTVARTPAWQADIIKQRSHDLLNNSWINLISWIIN